MKGESVKDEEGDDEEKVGRIGGKEEDDGEDVEDEDEGGRKGEEGEEERMMTNTYRCRVDLLRCK